jgi:hypothetical protein
MLCRCFGGYDYSGSETFDKSAHLEAQLRSQEPSLTCINDVNHGIVLTLRQAYYPCVHDNKGSLYLSTYVSINVRCYWATSKLG